jgi:hypothetical protein
MDYYVYQSACDQMVTNENKGNSFATSECLSDIYHMLLHVAMPSSCSWNIIETNQIDLITIDNESFELDEYCATHNIDKTNLVDLSRLMPNTWSYVDIDNAHPEPEWNDLPF